MFVQGHMGWKEEIWDAKPGVPHWNPETSVKESAVLAGSSCGSWQFSLHLALFLGEAKLCFKLMVLPLGRCPP